MTNTPIDIPAIAADIAAMMPNRCPNFLATLHDTITRYFDRPTPLDPEVRIAVADATITILFARFN